MKVTITMKDPDALYGGMELDVSYDHEELQDQAVEEARDAASPWLEYGECVTFTVDTDTGEARLKRVER